MSWRRLLFLSAFLIVPGALWMMRARPLLERRATALEQQALAETRRAEGQKKVQERDQLAAEWQNFRPLAEAEMVNLGNALNPILLQNRVLQLAKGLDCELQITEKRGVAEDAPLSYQIAGSGTPLQVHDLLDYLERGDTRGRFESMTVVYQAPQRGGLIQAYFNGILTVAQVPVIESSTLEEDA